MPFKSKSQMRRFFAMERRGDLPAGTARQWAHETKNIGRLPERVKTAHAIGFIDELNKYALNISARALAKLPSYFPFLPTKMGKRFTGIVGKPTTPRSMK